MEQERNDVYNDSPKDTTETGTDLPNADGTVSDEDVEAIKGENEDRPTGQDHSTEHHEERAPTDGVGAIQDNSLIKENVAHIVDEIKSRLNLVNEALIDPDDFELEKYDELLDLYRMIRKKGTLTPMEMEGILAELGELRKAKK